jgi:hypothetical protein
LSFVRQNEQEKVFCVINFSDEAKSVRFNESLYHGTYTDYFEQGNTLSLNDDSELELAPWGYKVFVR